MFTALNHILKRRRRRKKASLSQVCKISHTGIPGFPDCLPFSKYGESMCPRLQRWGVSPPFNVIKTKPVESWSQGFTACTCWLEAGSSSSPLPSPSPAAHGPYHPVKPSNVDQMERRILTGLLALPESPTHVGLSSSPLLPGCLARCEVLFQARVRWLPSPRFLTLYHLASAQGSTQEV